MSTYCCNGNGSIFNRMMLVILLEVCAALAHAQPAVDSATAQGLGALHSAEQHADSSTGSVPTPTPTPTCRDYDRFVSRGSEAPIITTCETLSPDLLGLRPKLYENG